MTGVSRRWPSIAAFAAGARVGDGLHAIALGTTELQLSLQGAVLEGDHAVVPVLFTGTLADAHLPGRPDAVADDAPRPAIRIADPARMGDETLQDSWYIGTTREPLPPLLTELLQAIAKRTGRELLLAGGYGGGFAALYQAHVLGSMASALVWNPHTDWLECQEAVVRRYLARAFPDIALPEEGGPTFRQAMAEVLRSRGVVHAVSDLVRSGASPRRLLYLQGATDPNLSKHAAPFMAAAGFAAVGDGFFSTGRDALLWFGGWAPGRAPPPPDLLASAFDYLRDPAAQVVAFRDAVARDGFGRYVRPSLAPRDLRGEGLPLQVSAVADAGLLRVHAQLGDLPEGDGQVAYAFYVHAGRERVATRWYEPGQTFFHHDEPGKPATRVAAFARDGFGHPMGMRDVAVVAAGPTGPRGEDAAAGSLATQSGGRKRTPEVVEAPGRRVLVYGSCVSRDAFALGMHDLALAGYIARSSLASAFDPHTPPARIHDLLGNIESAFQRRMVAWDVGRQATAILRATPCDVVLLDLIDERFSLVRLDSALVTVSPEFTRSGFAVDPDALIASGSAEHLSAWRRGLDAFVAAIGARPLVVNRVQWASHDNHGASLQDQARIARANATLEQMYAILTEVPGVRFIDYPDALLVADREHKWGVSPFHYVQEMYDHTMAELTRLIPHQRDAVSAASHNPREAE